MDLPKAFIGGLVGALAGIAVWALLGFAIGMDLGILVIGLGAAVGFGVRLLTKGEQDPAYGVAAVLVAIAATVIGKYVVTSLVTERKAGSAGAVVVAFTDEDMIAREARIIASQKVRAGAALKWPNGKSLSDAKLPADYPVEIAQEATTKWNGNSNKDGAKDDANKQEVITNMRMARAQRQNALSESFSLLNLLWILLSLAGAFFLGFGSTPKEEGDELGMIDDGSGLIKAADAD